MPLDEFFRAQTPARPLAVARAAFGFAAFIRACLQYRILLSLLEGDFIPVRRFDWLPGLTHAQLKPFMAVWIVSSLLFAAGFRTRLSGAVLTACVAYQILLDENLYANNFYLMALIAFLFTVADSGCSLSLDRLWFRQDPEQVARWSTLLPRLQISIVYFYSAVLKINPAFLAGEMIQRSTRPGVLLAGTWIPAAAAYATVALEFLLAFALWHPLTRRAAVLFAFLLHFNIFVGMDNAHTVAMFTFGTTTLAPLLLFLEMPRGSRVITWREASPAERRWAGIVRVLDWLGIHRLESNPASGAEWQLSFDGRTLKGFDAWREILCVLPISYYWAPLLYFPPFAMLGRRLCRPAAG